MLCTVEGIGLTTRVYLVIITVDPPCLISVHFHWLQPPCSHTGSHACGQSGVKNKNPLTQTEGRPRVRTVYNGQNHDSYTRTVIILYKYRGVGGLQTKIGARNKFDLHIDGSPAKPTPRTAQSLSGSPLRRKSRAKVARFKLTADTSAVRTSGIITTMILTL